jgi:hypothetical protein
VFVRKDLSIPQQVVQTSHACIEVSRNYLTPEATHPHLVVLSVENEEQLKQYAEKMKKAGIQYREFIEPDIGNQWTAVASEPLTGDRRKHFSNYRLLR